MNWYWIVLIIIGYICVWIVSSIIISIVLKNDDSYMCTLAGLFWPIIVMLSPIILLLYGVMYVFDKFKYTD